MLNSSELDLTKEATKQKPVVPEIHPEQINQNYDLGYLLGEGMTGTAWLVSSKSVPGVLAGEILVKKEAKNRTMAWGEMLQEGEVATYLQQNGLGELIAKVYGKSPDGIKQMPYLIKEYISGFSYKNNFSPDRLSPLPTSGALGVVDNKTGFWLTRKAEWCQKILTAVAEIHNKGVVLSDAKPEDWILTPNRQPDGSRVFSVKLLDLGNAKVENIHQLVGAQSKETDCRQYFNFVLEYGFALPPLPVSRKYYDSALYKSADVKQDWLVQIQRQNPHPALLTACAKYADWLEKGGDAPYKNGQELVTALRPVLEGFSGTTPTENKPAEQAHDFIKIGEVVRVRRSDGTVDEGWQLMGYNKHTGNAIVSKPEGAHIMKKEVPQDQLKALNLKK